MRTSLAGILVVLCGHFASAARPTDNRPPNVVFVLVDDLGWADLGYTGSSVYETPNVDRLAAEAAVFTHAYSGGPVCSPGRAALMTGKIPPGRASPASW